MNKINMLAVVVAGGAALSLAGAAQAQVQMPGWFGSLSGWYYYDNSHNNFELLDRRDNDVALKLHPGDGFGGRAYLGYRFMDAWDLALGAEGSWLSRGKRRALSGPNEDREGAQKADYWASDIELGYNGAMENFGYRLFAGARYAHFDHRMSGVQNDSDPILFDDKFRGFGPRIGAAGAYRFGASNFSVFGDAAVAYLFGRRKTDILSDHGASHDHGGHPDSLNVTGQLGVAYDIAPNTSIALGYRADYWSNVASSKGDMHGGDGPQLAYSGGDRLMHGPFVRVAYNIGAPRGVPMPMAAPMQGPVIANTFIIFFDWDRAVLTPQAKDTVKTAADAFKAKGNARVTLTGHADRSGSDQYNMALSLRRGAATKDELVRLGVPANAIVIIGKGESAPLVPTADGVREPQNRRVEIVLN